MVVIAWLLGPSAGVAPAAFSSFGRLSGHSRIGTQNCEEKGMAAKSSGRRSLADRLRVKPGSRVRLADWNPDEVFNYDRAGAADIVARDLARLANLQERLYAESKRGLLIVLQGIDAAGKDGTVTHVMSGFNPAGVVVTSFKVPTATELAHDYLWRIHDRTPSKGEIAIFNRSHYEDVLVVRVHGFAPQEVWSKRYDQINAFEKTLVEEGTTVLKFFLLISPDEQLQRFQARIDDPEKRWKFKTADLDERKLWPQYTEAFEDALWRCSTDVAPWYVIPANRKWFRNLAVAQIVADTLERMDPHYPPGEPGIELLKLV
jgi:PPK2 family polyphosphate:nucleotide phosphotransferase